MICWFMKNMRMSFKALFAKNDHQLLEFKAENGGIRVIDGVNTTYSQTKKGLTNHYYKRGLFMRKDDEDLSKKEDGVYTFPLIVKFKKLHKKEVKE